MKQKKLCLSLVFIAACLLNSWQFHADEINRDSFDDLIAFIDTPEVSDLIADTSFEIAPKTSKEAVIVLLDELGAFSILQQNFFLRTNKLLDRSLLDYPEFIPFRHDRDKRAVYVDLFYNQTSRMFFSKHSSNICAYLAVAEPGLINAINEVLHNVRSLEPNVNPDQLIQFLKLFQTFTVQERRFGLMIGGKTKFNRWFFNIMAPWYYLERNHFVNEDVQEDLIQLTDDIFGSPANPEEAALRMKQEKAFQDAHLISDKLGLGDTRIYCDYPVIKTKYVSTRLGFMATIPTAFAMAKGLRGSSFHLVKNRPLLDLQELVGTITAAASSGKSFNDPQATAFALTALDNLGAMILDSPLGNGGHFGLGVLIRNRSPLSSFIKQDWARRFIMRSFITFEYLFPGIEWRSFRVPVNEALFNARNLDQTDDMSVINSNYAFIQEQLTDRLFPIAIQARVNPGFVLRWSSQTCYEGDTAGFTIGTDTYVRNKEKLTHLNATPFTKHMIDITHAQAPFAYQSKLVGSIFFKVEKPDKLWTISLVGDYTYMNKGIGSDFMLALNTDVIF